MKIKYEDVSTAMALLLKEQCMGEYCGHMANIPNNPVLFGLCKAQGIDCTEDFADFLLYVSERLREEAKK